MTPLLLLALAPAAPIPAGALKPADNTKLDGVWELKAREYRGQPTPVSDALKPTYTLIVANGQFSFRTYAGTLKVDAEKKTVEMAITAGTYANQTTGGVFERTGDTLKVALPRTPRAAANGRPAELKTTETTTHDVYTFELNKAVTAEKAAEQVKDRLATLANRPNPFALPGGGFAVPPGVAPAPVLPGGAVVPARPGSPAEQLQQALERIEKLEKRIAELEKQLPKK